MSLFLDMLSRRVRRALIANRVLRVNKPADCLKWGIVGTGYMATIWADMLLVSRVGVLEAVCSRSEIRSKNFARRFACNNAFGSLEKMLTEQGSELDFVYVATPLESHYGIIKKCIQAGVNVLCEKPAVQTAEEWATLSGLARQRGLLLIEGMWMLCLPTFKQADRWIADGLIGDVRLIKADLNKFQHSSRTESRSDDGVLMDYGVYALSFARHFLGGYPECCESHLRRNINGDDADWTIVCSRRGIKAVINLSSNFHSSSAAAVIGETGMIEWTSPFNRTGKVCLHGFQVGQRQLANFSYRHSGFEFQLEEVTQTLRSGLSESRLLSQRSTLEVLELVGHLFRNNPPEPNCSPGSLV